MDKKAKLKRRKDGGGKTECEEGTGEKDEKAKGK
jgi:hypothetical protein